MWGWRAFQLLQRKMRSPWATHNGKKQRGAHAHTTQHTHSMADAKVPGTKLRAKIEAQTQAYVLSEAERVNRRAATDVAAPTAEVLGEVFDRPDEVWPVARVKTVVVSLRKDYMRMLLPHLNLDTREIAADAPTDETLRERLIRSSTTYATLARSNQHATWFKFFTDRTRTDKDRKDAFSIFEMRVAVENGKITEAEATAQLSQTRAGILAKERALQHLDEIKASGRNISKKQERDARAAVAAAKKAEEPKRSAAKSRQGGVAAIPPELLARLRAKVASTMDAAAKVG